MTGDAIGVVVICAALLAACGEGRRARTEPAGAETTAKTEALKTGAAILQTNAPLSGMDVYLVGFHPMKEDASHQMEAHHFCKQVNEDFAQCALFDGNSGQANLNGIEYIISEKLFETLPQEERRFWHPHNYEILSGQLVAPGIPEVASEELMRGKMNSYGKTFHLWSTSRGDKLPMGEPMLAWSFNRDGEAKQGLIERRDKAMEIDSREIRRRRQELVGLAKPQQGVDALKGAFQDPTQSIPGVTAKEGSSRSATNPR